MGTSVQLILVYLALLQHSIHHLNIHPHLTQIIQRKDKLRFPAMTANEYLRKWPVLLVRHNHPKEAGTTPWKDRTAPPIR